MVRKTEFTGAPTGAVSVMWPTEREISPHEIALFESVCDAVGGAIGQAQTLQDLEEKNRMLQREYADRTALLERRLRSEALHRDISAGIRSKRSLRDIANETASRVGELFDADFVAIHYLIGLPQEFLAVGGKAPREVLVKSISPPTITPVHAHRLARLLQQPVRTIVRSDWDSYIPEFDGGGPGDAPERMDAYLSSLRASGVVVGMVRATEFDGRCTGAIGLFWGTQRDISSHEVSLFESVCDVVGCAIGQATILNDLEEKNKLLQIEYAARTTALEHRLRSEALVRDISAGICSKRGLREIAVETASRVRELFDADCVAIHCLFGLPQEFRVLHLKEGPSEPLVESPLQDLSAHAHRIRRLHYGQPVHTVTVQDWEAFLPGIDSGGPGEDPEQMALLRDRLRALGIRFGMTRGTGFCGALTGVLCVSWREERAISQHDRALFESVTDCVGFAIGQTKMLQDLETKNAELEAEHAERTASLERRLRSEALLRDIAVGIRSKQSVREILRDTAPRIQRLLDCDMVSVRALPLSPPEQEPAFGGPGEIRVTVLRGGLPSEETPPQNSAALNYRLHNICRRPVRTFFRRDWSSFLPEFDGGGPGEGPEAKECLSSSIQEFQMRSGMSRATEWGGSVTGLVTAGWADGRATSEHELAVFESLCDSIGHALGQEQLLLANNEKNRMLQAELARSNLLRSMTAEIRNTLSPDKIVESTAHRLREALGADTACILTLDGAIEDIDVLNVGGMTIVEADKEEAVHVPDPKLAAVLHRVRAAARSRATYAVADLEEAQAWAGEASARPGGLADEGVLELTRRFCFRSCLLKATSAGGRVNGLVSVHWQEPGRACRLCPEDVALFEDVCQAVGIALGQARLVQQAQQAARAKSDFLSVVTHELRTPMQAVVGITDLLLDTPLSPFQREYLMMARASGQALVDLVGEVLDASVLERGGAVRVAPAPMCLRACLEEVVDVMWPARPAPARRPAPPPLSARAQVTAQKGIVLQLALEWDFPRFIVSDRGRLRQVVVNLIGNSAKFADEGRIVVEVEAGGCPDPAGRHLFRIAVTDTGCGIPADQQRRLFEFFGQLDTSKARRHPGTGLGLYISQGIARALDGEIAVVSTPGTGSTFAVTFRAAVLSPADARAIDRGLKGPLVPDPLLRGKTLLAAFDEEVWGRTLAGDAERWGMRVLHARRPQAVLEAVRGEVEAGRGPLLAAVALFMPSALPPEALAGFVDDALAELARAAAEAPGGGGGACAPPALLLLRASLQIEPPHGRARVRSLRMPVAESVLHATLAEAVRERESGPGSGAAAGAAPSSPAPAAPTVEPGSTESSSPRPAAAPEGKQAGVGVGGGVGGGFGVEGARGAPNGPRPAAPTEGPDSGAAAEFRPRILFAEDTPTNARIVAMQLRKLGYGDVAHAPDGRRALEAARAAAAARDDEEGPGSAGRPFDVLLSDIMMPEMDGLESLRRMRAELPAGRVPYAIALSANVGAHDRRECADAGYDAFLAKPVRAGELQAALAAAAQRLRERREREPGQRLRAGDVGAPAGAQGSGSGLGPHACVSGASLPTTPL
eukprot:tig00021501_g21945.t1